MIAATILAGNNIGIVGDAILSVVEHVDSVILIDTGITDGTREIVERVCGRHHRPFFCRRLKWCNDFSFARNFSLRAAEDIGAKWALTLDTDERMQFDCDAFELANRVDLPDMDAWLVPYEDGTYAKERFIRTGTKQRWRGRTHECLTGTVNRSVLQGCTFTELGKPPTDYKKKLFRDIELLTEQIAEEPRDPRWHFYLGQTYSCLGRHGEAVESFRRAGDLPGWDEQAAWAYFKAAEGLCILGDVRQARDVCGLGLAKYSGMVELPWLAGYCSQRLGENHKAVWWAEMAVLLNSMKAGAARISFRHLPAWFEGPFDVLRFSYKFLGEHDNASLAEHNYQQAKAARLNIS